MNECWKHIVYLQSIQFFSHYYYTRFYVITFVAEESRDDDETLLSNEVKKQKWKGELFLGKEEKRNGPKGNIWIAVALH